MQLSLPLWVYVLTLAIGPAVGGALALLGAFGGPWLKARTDVDQWRRDKRLDAYAELSRTMTELLVAEYEYLRGAALRPTVTKAARQTLHDVIRAEARVRLIAPETVRQSSRELGRQIQSLATHFDIVITDEALAQARGTGRMDELDDAVRELHAPTDNLIQEIPKTYESFMNAARRDLGV